MVPIEKQAASPEDKFSQSALSLGSSNMYIKNSFCIYSNVLKTMKDWRKGSKFLLYSLGLTVQLCPFDISVFGPTVFVNFCPIMQNQRSWVQQK